MRSWRIWAACVVIVVVLGGCGVGLFGPNKNKIMHWVQGIEETTTISYRYTAKYTGFDDETYSFQAEVLEVDVRETRTIVELLFDGDRVYLIADDNRGEMVYSLDDLIDDDDAVLLETPVEEGTSWISHTIRWVWNVENARYTIEETGVTESVGAETLDDVVRVSVDIPDDIQDSYGYTVSRYDVLVSPSLGLVGFSYKDTDDDDGAVYSLDLVVTDVSRP